ncbi:hypothetical protein FV139_14975 [Parahaliea maris]|uniref:DUF3108 domain-containing protein n=1 Tax=Parahaliea maris TaxID=2716870 RepID=A0A5C8ZU90_9GAMM|nr:hypothetical protein [Parahaliea maris]TXS92026.1 hypothetical protein FV139_14975 [Parahaliea maris]
MTANVTPLPPEQCGMRHRSYRGKFLYVTEGVGEMGREYFDVTVQPGGSRTLRARCEMDDYRLLRDVVMSVGQDWRPVDAFVRLTAEEQFVGSSWYRFDGCDAECEGLTAEGGRISRRASHHSEIECFGTHSLHGDAWLVGRLRNFTGEMKDFEIATFATSTLANGGSGPDLIHLEAGFSTSHDLGLDEVTVPAGTFNAQRVLIEVPGVDDFEIWAYGQDCVPVQVISHGLNQYYHLVELEGEVE